MKREEAEAMAKTTIQVLQLMARGHTSRLKLEADYEYGPYYRLLGDGWAATAQGHQLCIQTLTDMLLRDGED